MSTVWVAFFSGCFLGSILGSVALSLCVIAKRSDRDLDEMFDDVVPPNCYLGISFRFPRAKFVSDNGIIGQTSHVETELVELKYELFNSPDIAPVAEEAMDLHHSTETLLRILEEKHGVDIFAVSRMVEDKNRARGYYA